MKEDKTTQETTQEIDKTTQEIEKTTQENIINIINKKPQITLQEIANILKITRDGVKYHITKLQEQGIIKHEGATKAGKWIIIKKGLMWNQQQLYLIVEVVEGIKE